MIKGWWVPLWSAQVAPVTGQLQLGHRLGWDVFSENFIVGLIKAHSCSVLVPHLAEQPWQGRPQAKWTIKLVCVCVLHTRVWLFMVTAWSIQLCALLVRLC